MTKEKLIKQLFIMFDDCKKEIKSDVKVATENEQFDAGYSLASFLAIKQYEKILNKLKDELTEK